MSDGSGSAKDQRENEPRPAIAPVMSGVDSGHPMPAALLPNFTGLMNESLGDNKRKSAQEGDDLDKRYRSADPQTALLQTLIATVEQMRQTQAQTFDFMTGMIQHLQQSGNNFGVPHPAAEPVSNAQGSSSIAEVVKAVAEATTAAAKPGQRPKVPDEVKQAITKYMKRTSDRITKNIRANKRLEMAKSDLEEMGTPGRYPAGTRPFKSQADMAELDEPLDECSGNDFVFAVTIPARTSRREALAILHHSLTKETKRINTLALEERVAKEKAMLKREQIMIECQAIVDKIRDVDHLGLDDPIQRQSIDEAIQVLQEEEYGKVIQDIRTKEQKTKEEAEKRKAQVEKEKQKILESHPSTLMKDAVESIVEAKIREVQHEIDGAMNEEHSSDDHINVDMERACSALQKNGTAPTGGKGTHAKTSKAKQQWHAHVNPRSWNQWQQQSQAKGYGKNGKGGYTGKQHKSWAAKGASWTRY